MIRNFLILTVLFISLPAFAALGDPGFHNESEAGVVLVSGNAKTTTINLSQQNSQAWEKNVFRFDGKLLRATSRGALTSRYWTLGLRYERELTEKLSAIVGYNIESDIFAGYNPRHNFDVGPKYTFVKSDEFTWVGEVGYRYTLEHRTSFDSNVVNHYARAYTEANKQWTKTAASKFWVEYLPNFTTFAAYRINTELSSSLAINSALSVKLGYLIRYNNRPTLPGGATADRYFTTALVAKF